MNNNKKICVVSFYTPNYDIGIQIEPIHRMYCLKHNYDYKCFYEIPDKLKDRHAAWTKLYYIDLVLKDKEKYDYVMWIDADAFFCNHDIKIEKWITNEQDLFICRDAAASFKQWNVYKNILNSGVMIFKNTDWSYVIIDFILKYGGFIPFYNKATWEQVGIRKCYQHNHHYFKQHCHVITDLKFNCNTDNINTYIKNGGYILHLTSFNGKWIEKNSKFIDQFKNLNNI